MKDTNTPQGTTPVTGITPEVGKRYVTRGGWITPPLEAHDDDIFTHKTGIRSFTQVGKYFAKGESDLDLIAEYVEPTVPDTYRRDLIAALYVESVASVLGVMIHKGERPISPKADELVTACIGMADTLIQAMEAAK